MKLLRMIINENNWQENLGNQEVKDREVAFIGVERYDDHYELARKCYVNKIPGITAIGDKKLMT